MKKPDKPAQQVFKKDPLTQPISDEDLAYLGRAILDGAKNPPAGNENRETQQPSPSEEESLYDTADTRKIRKALPENESLMGKLRRLLSRLTG